jgi:DNA-binding LacI/PurR family transcriptional regulator
MAPPTAPRKPRRPSLRDIAEAVGTTRMTVSRCLRDPQTVSEPLRQRIQETARHLNYLPNRAPMMLAQSRSRSIGVLVPSVTNQVFADVLAGIIDETGAADYRAMITHYGHDAAAEERSIAALLAYNADGLILSDRTHTEATRRMIDGAGVAIVEIMDTRKPALQQAVGYDNHAAACDMVTAMIARGHRRIAVISALVQGNDRAADRVRGVRDALRACGLPDGDLTVIETPYGIDTAATAMTTLMQTATPPTAVMCGNDVLAAGAVLAAQAMGLDVPGDVSVTGFDDLELARIVSPALTTMQVPHREMGVQAAKALMALVEGAPRTPPLRLDVTLKLRASLGPAKEG